MALKMGVTAVPELPVSADFEEIAMDVLNYGDQEWWQQPDDGGRLDMTQAMIDQGVPLLTDVIV